MKMTCLRIIVLHSAIYWNDSIISDLHSVCGSCLKHKPDFGASDLSNPIKYQRNCFTFYIVSIIRKRGKNVWKKTSRRRPDDCFCSVHAHVEIRCIWPADVWIPGDILRLIRLFEVHFKFCHLSHLRDLSRFIRVKPNPDCVQSKFIISGYDIRGSASWSYLARTSIGSRVAFEEDWTKIERAWPAVPGRS